MIRFLLEHDKGGRLLSFDASGHAGYGQKGHDIVCAAVTILIRTTVQALGSIHAEAHAEQRGRFAFQVVQYDEKDAEQLRYAAQFLWLGMTSLQEEYPKAIQCKQIQR